MIRPELFKTPHCAAEQGHALHLMHAKDAWFAHIG
jgi:hypothetical protein